MEVDMDIKVDYHDSTSVAQKLKLIPRYLLQSYHVTRMTNAQLVESSLDFIICFVLFNISYNKLHYQVRNKR